MLFIKSKRSFFIVVLLLRVNRLKTIWISKIVLISKRHCKKCIRQSDIEIK